MTQGLGNVAFPRAARTNDEDAHFFFHKPAGGKFRDQAAIDVWVEGEVKLLQGFLVAKVGSANSRCQSFLSPAGNCRWE